MIKPLIFIDSDTGFQQQNESFSDIRSLNFSVIIINFQWYALLKFSDQVSDFGDPTSLGVLGYIIW
jgi:hypothetical protein